VLAAVGQKRYLHGAMQELFEAVRAACPSGVWSKGVELVRQFAVTKQSSDSTPIICRVRMTDRAIPATVQLYPEDAEWDCDCAARTACCEHVAAAVIAIKKAQAGGKALPDAMSSAANLGYRFSRLQGELKLEQLVVRSDASKVPLRGSLASVVAQHAAGLDLAPTQEDLQLDRLIGKNGQIRPDQILSVLKLLAGHRNVEFEGKPIEVASEPLKPHATITAGDAGFLVRLTPDPQVQQVVASYVGLTDSALVPLAATDYCGAQYQHLVPEKLYGPDEVAVLVTEILPDLKRWFVVDLQTDRLAEVTSDERPRIVVEVHQQGDELNVLATLVYGDPPIARIDRNRLVHLGGPIPIRKLDLERRAMEHLRQSLGIGVGTRSVVSGKEALQLASKLDHWHGEITGNGVAVWVNDVSVLPRLNPGDTLPRFCAKTADGPELVASAVAVVKAYRAGVSLVPLLDGGFARLPTDWLAQHIGLLERLLAAQTADAPSRLSPHALPALAALHAVLDTALPSNLAPARQLLLGLADLPRVEPPKDLTVKLRPYQALGVNWLHLMRTLGLGAILADDMGLGKTLQALCSVVGRTLIICPTTLLANWLAEVRRFRPTLSTCVYHGQDRRLAMDAGVTLTTYAVLRLDVEQLAGCHWDTVVLDEAQTIKNPESQVAQAAFALDAGFRMTMTGTPVENRLDDLWSLLHFTNPGLLGTRNDFQSRYVEPIQNGQTEGAAQLRQILGPFVLRRTKQNVLPELPPRAERDLCFELDDEERRLYQGLHLLAQREVMAQLSEGHNLMQALEALLRLRQAACHPSLVPGQSAETSSKIVLLVERLTAAIADGHKSLVFSQWTSFLDLIEPHLSQACIDYARLDGSTKDRGQVVDRFQRDDGPPVLLLSLKAGGTGLNLTAADHVFLMDLWWNPAVEQQAADRAHRIGQQRPVMIHRLVAKDTVEERILALHAQKRALSDAALEDAEQAARLSRDELLALLA
jgi:superfamily II DNA or RNA helicase